MKWKSKLLETGEEVKYQDFSDMTEYLGTRDINGVSVNTFEGCFHNVPLVGEFKACEDMENLAKGLKKCGVKNFVVHMRHSHRGAYVLHTEDGKNLFVRI